VGDAVYGRGKELGLTSQCLHARSLTFRHPKSGKFITVDSELPEYFVQTLQKLGAPVG
jgi:23S rRNA pseudouridine1911/1915/1917 synthase